MAKFGLGTSMQQSLGQHMQLLPRMLQAIEVLQLSSQDLEAWVTDAVSDNEALSLDAPLERGFSSDGSAARTAGPRGTRADSDRHAAFLESQPARGQTLAERLEENLAVLDLGPRAHGWLRLLLESLDENGWLAPSDEQLLAEAGDRQLEGGALELARARERLRALEPRGLGARGPLEAMLFQIDDDDP
ncbi:MAG: hypothetical protein ABIP42_08285, partial [Planctomycetota bacterium]